MSRLSRLLPLDDRLDNLQRNYNGCIARGELERVGYEVDQDLHIAPLVAIDAHEELGISIELDSKMDFLLARLVLEQVKDVSEHLRQVEVLVVHAECAALNLR